MDLTDLKSGREKTRSMMTIPAQSEICLAKDVTTEWGGRHFSCRNAEPTQAKQAARIVHLGLSSWPVLQNAGLRSELAVCTGRLIALVGGKRVAQGTRGRTVCPAEEKTTCVTRPERNEVHEHASA